MGPWEVHPVWDESLQKHLLSAYPEVGLPGLSKKAAFSRHAGREALSGIWRER